MPSVKVNFILEDKVKDELISFIPSGKRSKVVNEAIKKELLFLKRKSLTEKLLKLRAKGPKVSTRELIETLEENRRKH